MRECNNILVVVQNTEEAKNLLPKARRLANIEEEATVHVIRVAYEGLAELDVKDVEASTDLKNFILQGEEDSLKEAIAASGTNIDRLETATLWGRKSWEVILHAAESVDADLILKAASRPDGVRIIRTPDDWNLLRHSKIPVLLCDSKPWALVPRLVAAVDVFDDDHNTLNVRILRQADGLAEGLAAQLQIVSAFPSLAPLTPNFATFQNYQSMMEEIEKDAAARLQCLLETHEMHNHRGRSIEGRAEEAIKKVIEEEAADMLVLGTTARSGLEGVVIGNTAEQILQDTQIDVLTVP